MQVQQLFSSKVWQLPLPLGRFFKQTEVEWTEQVRNPNSCYKKRRTRRNQEKATVILQIHTLNQEIWP